MPVPRGRLISGRSRSSANAMPVRSGAVRAGSSGATAATRGDVDQDVETNAGRGLLVRESDHGDAEFPAVQRGEHPLRGVLGQGDLHRGVVLVEPGQDGGQVELIDCRGRARDEAEGDLAAQQPGELLRGLPYRFDGGERGPQFFGADLDGIELRATDLDWSFGTGTPLSGTAQDLLLLAYGRRLPPGHLRGEPGDRFLAAQSGPPGPTGHAQSPGTTSPDS